VYVLCLGLNAARAAWTSFARYCVCSFSLKGCFQGCGDSTHEQLSSQNPQSDLHLSIIHLSSLPPCSQVETIRKEVQAFLLLRALHRQLQAINATSLPTSEADNAGESLGTCMHVYVLYLVRGAQCVVRRLIFVEFCLTVLVQYSCCCRSRTILTTTTPLTTTTTNTTTPTFLRQTICTGASRTRASSLWRRKACFPPTSPPQVRGVR